MEAKLSAQNLDTSAPFKKSGAPKSGSKMISRIISYVGAGIIFATFVVKDIMRERLKDLNDSINAAEMFYSNQSSIEQTQLQMIDVEMTVGTVNLNIVDQKANEVVRYQHQMRLLYGTAADKLSITEAYIKNLSRLIAKLPHEESQQRQANSLLSGCMETRSQAQAIPGQFDALIKKYSEAIGEDASPPPGAMKQLNALMKQAQTFEHEGASLGASIKTLTDSVLASARKHEEKGELQYSRATVASYVLYFFGWGLALVGRVFFGAKEEEES